MNRLLLILFFSWSALASDMCFVVSGMKKGNVEVFPKGLRVANIIEVNQRFSKCIVYDSWGQAFKAYDGLKKDNKTQALFLQFSHGEEGGVANCNLGDEKPDDVLKKLSSISQNHRVAAHISSCFSGDNIEVLLSKSTSTYDASKLCLMSLSSPGRTAHGEKLHNSGWADESVKNLNDLYKNYGVNSYNENTWTISSAGWTKMGLTEHVRSGKKEYAKKFVDNLLNSAISHNNDNNFAKFCSLPQTSTLEIDAYLTFAQRADNPYKCAIKYYKMDSKDLRCNKLNIKDCMELLRSSNLIEPETKKRYQYVVNKKKRLTHQVELLNTQLLTKSGKKAQFDRSLTCEKFKQKFSDVLKDKSKLYFTDEIFGDCVKYGKPIKNPCFDNTLKAGIARDKLKHFSNITLEGVSNVKCQNVLECVNDEYSKSELAPTIDEHYEDVANYFLDVSGYANLAASQMAKTSKPESSSSVFEDAQLYHLDALKSDPSTYPVDDKARYLGCENFKLHHD